MSEKKTKKDPSDNKSISSTPLTPKEEMANTFHSIWKHASQKEKTYIKDLWTKMMKPVHVLKWKLIKTNEYQLELQQEILGSHPEIPLGHLVLKQKMRIGFSEEKISGTNNYRQMITFLDQGVCFRVGIGWLSKETPLKRILIEENPPGDVWCTVEALGQNMTRSAEETLNFWKQTQWV